MRWNLLLGVLALTLFGVVACSNTKAVNEAVKGGNRGIAFGQCVQEAVQKPGPELASAACVSQWFPEVGTSGDAGAKAAAAFAACVRSGVSASRRLEGDARTMYLIQIGGTCTAE